MNRPHRKPMLRLQPTTLWDYPSQHYGDDVQGDPNYRGATPSYIIWNLLQRYTEPRAAVVDPCCGSGTTLDVCRDTDRRARGFDINPQREDIEYADARKLPLRNNSADFVFIDPPYSTHLEYSDDPACIGQLSAISGEYYRAMEKVIAEINRILKPRRYMAMYVSDSYEHNRGKQRAFHPIGFELFQRLRKPFVPVDVISVVRHNKTLELGNYRRSAEEGNYYLRGFNYLFIMYKAASAPKPRGEKKPPHANRQPRKGGPRKKRTHRN